MPEALERRATSLIRQLKERIEPHLVVGFGPLALIAEQHLPLLAMQPLEEPLRPAKQPEPLLRQFALSVRPRRLSQTREFFKLQAAEQLVLQGEKKLARAGIALAGGAADQLAVDPRR